MGLVHLFDFADREDTAATYDGRVLGFVLDPCPYCPFHFVLTMLSIFAEYDVRSATS